MTEKNRRSVENVAVRIAIKHILRHLMLAFGLLTLLRILFLTYNWDQFTHSSSISIVEALIQGLRFDLKLIYYSWLPLMFIDCLTFRSKTVVKWGQKVWLAVVSINAGVDTGYYAYSKVRNGREILLFFDGSNNISLWTYVLDYSFLTALVIMIFVLASRFLDDWRADWPPIKRPRIAFTLFLGVLLFIPMRGGISGRPLRSSDAHLFVQSGVVPVALNSTLLLIEQEHSTNGIALVLETGLPGEKSFFGNDSLIKPNFVLIFLESFGKEYTGLNHNYTFNYTPNLNELMSKSLVCRDAYATGLRSVDAVPAVYSGIPRLGSASFSQTPFAFNQIESVNSLLGAVGYSSHFYHGAESSTMGFQSFLKSGGLHCYHSIEDYPNSDKHHDGHWGIYDGPYLDYFRTELDTMKQPFVASVFTLSSHHPYSIPKEWKDSFDNGTLEIHASIGYTDRMLGLFMERAERTSWFENTIFIIMADHSSENAMHAYRTPSGKYEIPLLLYSPKWIKAGSFEETTGQTDILPTILDLVNYQDSVYTFGESIFATDRRSLVLHNDNFSYHITQNGWNYGVAESDLKPLFLFDKINDPNCLENVLALNPDRAAKLDSLLRLKLSEYHARMAKNAFN